MPIELREDQFPNITEVWGYGTNTIVVHTTEGRCVKITAEHNIRGGSTPNYYAAYEERKEIRIGSESYEIWVKADYPWQHGNTVQECLLLALGWVNDRSK